MNNKLVVAAIATAALAVGGSSLAFAGGGTSTDLPVENSAASVRTDDRDDDRDDRQQLRNAQVTLKEAVDAALKSVPGTAESAELDDDDNRLVWDVDILGENGTWHEVKVDAGSADVLGQDKDRDDDGDDDDDGADDRDDRDDDDDRDDRDDRDDDDDQDDDDRDDDGRDDD